ncbi:AAA family ATPase [Bifidobacterium adolescentis]|uniref:ATP-binding protein n=1 Tax=Bifidobacterium adolescentis TaxID=1680 RepID=UPI0018DBFFC6|nr:ATP-binding protein [Bifidobacterium adolescentis]MBH8620644.1 AAA family ATPase [Bifidobacterium adolescentis]
MENELLRQELNPFMPGAGMQPPELVGRERDLEIVDRMIARTKLNNLDRGIIFSGLRGVGKTVLLVKLQEMAAGKNMLTAKIESSGNPDDDYEAIFHEINLAAMKIHLVGGLKKRLGDVISNIKSMSFGAFGLSASVSRESSAQTSENPFKLELLIESITTELRKSNSGLYLFIDELQEMADEPLGTLMSIQHKMGQRSLPFYIIGAGLPNLPGVLSKSRSYAERLFEYRTIGQLSDTDAAEGFQKPARRNGRPFTDDALNELIKVSSGYPYFIQAYGKAAWNASGSNPIPLQAVTKSEACARAELDDGLYSARWQRTTPTGRRYLAAMAKIGTESPSSTAEVADRLGKSTGEISMTRDKLIKLGLIYSPEYGKVAFTVPGMGEFILRAMPSDGQVYDGR